ncbi:type II secretion system protein GspM [Marilutibacter chinensis]|uniref:Type II secretion system protein M n=1 Tax=Marilutibacter chinensis TaxID=2912247 RepID=A0ABS9HUN8_9GAMM|nr:type II secretion system protein GspM [Lysobacter chinensis]MCF7222624.1 type II secretion system protein M [Lysobacter chinensis]
MNALQGLREWWRARDARERRMLAAMVVMLAAFVYWYGLLTPLRHLREAARTDYDRAAADVLAVRALAAELQAFETRRAGGGSDARTLLKSAADAGIAISRQRLDASGTLSLGIDSVQAGPLFAWLAELRRSHAIGPRTLHMEKRDGALRVEMALVLPARDTEDAGTDERSEGR